MGTESKRSFYVWFLGARECKGLRGEEFVRPLLRYFKDKEEEQEPAKVTLQISSRGVKLVADSFKHFIPSHALTYISQCQPPDDDIISVILLLYNPVTKCPIHLHSYRCDSVHTAELLRDQLRALTEQPENQRKIRDLEERLQSQGLYRSRLLKSTDTGFTGSIADLPTADGDSAKNFGEALAQSSPTNRGTSALPKLLTATSMPKNDQERIARLYDSLAAELRDKLSGNAQPLLLPPRDYEREPVRNKNHQLKRNLPETQANGRVMRESPKSHHEPRRKEDAGSSGRSSGIGSDLDDHSAQHSPVHSGSREILSTRELQESYVLQRGDRSRLRNNRELEPAVLAKDKNPGRRDQVKQVLSQFECSSKVKSKQPEKCHQYNELGENERFPGLDRDTARLEHHFVTGNNLNLSKKEEKREQREQLTYRNESVPVSVQPIANRHFKAVRYNQHQLDRKLKNQLKL